MRTIRIKDSKTLQETFAFLPSNFDTLPDDAQITLHPQELLCRKMKAFIVSARAIRSALASNSALLPNGINTEKLKMKGKGKNRIMQVYLATSAEVNKTGSSYITR